MINFGPGPDGRSDLESLKIFYCNTKINKIFHGNYNLLNRAIIMTFNWLELKDCIWRLKNICTVFCVYENWWFAILMKILNYRDLIVNCTDLKTFSGAKASLLKQDYLRFEMIYQMIALEEMNSLLFIHNNYLLSLNILGENSWVSIFFKCFFSPIKCQIQTLGNWKSSKIFHKFYTTIIQCGIEICYGQPQIC